MIIIIIFSRCHFRATYRGLKAKQAEGPRLGLYADLEAKIKAKRAKRKAEDLFYYIFTPLSCLSVLTGDNRHLFPVDIPQQTVCAAEGTGKRLLGVRPQPRPRGSAQPGRPPASRCAGGVYFSSAPTQKHLAKGKIVEEV